MKMKRTTCFAMYVETLNKIAELSLMYERGNASAFVEKAVLFYIKQLEKTNGK